MSENLDRPHSPAAASDSSAPMRAAASAAAATKAAVTGLSVLRTAPCGHGQVIPSSFGNAGAGADNEAGFPPLTSAALGAYDVASDAETQLTSANSSLYARRAVSNPPFYSRFRPPFRGSGQDPEIPRFTAALAATRQALQRAHNLSSPPLLSAGITLDDVAGARSGTLPQHPPQCGGGAFDDIVLVDFECACEQGRAGERGRDEYYEIIEFPAVLIDAKTFTIKDVFHSYVRPTERPTLTPFCVSLTGISQETVDAAPPLVEVLAAFSAWLDRWGTGFMALPAAGWVAGSLLPPQCEPVSEVSLRVAAQEHVGDTAPLFAPSFGGKDGSFFGRAHGGKKGSTAVRMLRGSPFGVLMSGAEAAARSTDPYTDAVLSAGAAPSPTELADGQLRDAIDAATEAAAAVLFENRQDLVSSPFHAIDTLVPGQESRLNARRRRRAVFACHGGSDVRDFLAREAGRKGIDLRWVLRTGLPGVPLAVKQCNGASKSKASGDVPEEEEGETVGTDKTVGSVGRRYWASAQSVATYAETEATAAAAEQAEVQQRMAFGSGARIGGGSAVKFTPLASAAPASSATTKTSSTNACPTTSMTPVAAERAKNATAAAVTAEAINRCPVNAFTAPVGGNKAVKAVDQERYADSLAMMRLALGKDSAFTAAAAAASETVLLGSASGNASGKSLLPTGQGKSLVAALSERARELAAHSTAAADQGTPPQRPSCWLTSSMAVESETASSAANITFVTCKTTANLLLSPPSAIAMPFIDIRYACSLAFKSLRRLKQLPYVSFSCKVNDMLEGLKLNYVGREHSGIADTLNITKVFFILAQTRFQPFVNDFVTFDPLPTPAAPAAVSSKAAVSSDGPE